MRKTKIICTLGPASDSMEKIEALLAAGANIFRLNMSHAPHEWVRDVVKRIRAAAKAKNVNCGILLDTQGPAIRTGNLSAKLNLKPGDIFEFTVRGARSEEEYSVDVNYDGLVNDIHVGDTVLVDNGVLHMKVLEKDQNRVRCEVLTEQQRKLSALVDEAEILAQQQVPRQCRGAGHGISCVWPCPSWLPCL